MPAQEAFPILVPRLLPDFREGLARGPAAGHESHSLWAVAPARRGCWVAGNRNPWAPIGWGWEKLA